MKIKQWQKSNNPLIVCMYVFGKSRTCIMQVAYALILNECFVFSTNKFGVARMLVKIG